MVVINEATKTKTKANTVHVFEDEVPALNTEDSLTDQCTWHCHTKGCSHRNKNLISLGPIDTRRSMIIESLGVSNGNTYQTMTVLILVIIWPVLMFGLVVANVELFIRNRKKNA